MQYLYFSSGTLVVFIMALIAGKRTRVPADYLLLAWLLLILANLVTFFIASLPVFQGWERGFIVFSEVSLFLHGPVFWLYTCSLTRPFFRLIIRNLLHLIPFAAGLIYLLATGDKGTLFFFKLASLLIYTTAVIRQLRRYRNSVQHIFSNTEEKYLGWLRFLSWGMLILWGLAAGGILVGRWTPIPLSLYENDFLSIATSLFIIAMCYFAIRQSPIIYTRAEPVKRWPDEAGHAGVVGRDVEETDVALADVRRIDVTPAEQGGYDPSEDIAAISDPVSGKYRKSGLGTDRSKKLYGRLLEVMEKDKPYLDAELTLFSLAAILNWPPNHLSQVINAHEQKNFFDFVNGYRIAAVQRYIRSGQYEHLTLLSLAYECGFNSKAAFNRAFRKLTGTTPSAFRRGEARED